MPRRGLYAITRGSRSSVLQRTAATIAGGARIVQYRNKRAPHADRYRDAIALREICRPADVLLIINDDVELAAQLGAGVHLGEDDADIASARAALGPAAIIGVSCYDSIERARSMAAEGADYLAFGAFFPSPSKPQARRADPGLLEAASEFGLPRVAIGGITPDNGRALIRAGADFLAAISALFDAADTRAAAQAFTDLFESEPEPTSNL